jgi:uncharacterized protein YjiS (DUF1127 family)
MTRTRALDDTAAAPASGAAQAWRATLAWLVGGRERRRQRQALCELSDELLKDIGATRAEAWAEASKPWWR